MKESKEMTRQRARSDSTGIDLWHIFCFILWNKCEM